MSSASNYLSSVFTKSFKQDVPIIQAPMAGGITTPELVAAVSNAGALGSLGAGYMTPTEIRDAIKKIKSLTQKPFNVNLFVPERSNFMYTASVSKVGPGLHQSPGVEIPASGSYVPNIDPLAGTQPRELSCSPGPTFETLSVYDLSLMHELLTPLWCELSDAPFETSYSQPPSFEEQAQVIFEEKVPIFSFTFGIPPSSIIERFKTQGTLICGTATTPEEAKELENAGVDAIVCQGQEAGGHRGNFSSHDPLYGLLTLLALTKEAVKIPLIAAGGIMNGRSVSATILAGACAAQLGTAFITTTESGASPAYKEALLMTPHLPTALTKAFTGKPARAIVNTFMQKLENQKIPPYPIQHFLTQRLRSLAASKNHPDLMSLWAGQGYPLCRSISAAALIHRIVKEFDVYTSTFYGGHSK